MKKWMMMAFAALMAALPAEAQVYRNSRYYNPANGRLDYRNQRPPRSLHNRMADDAYFGFRIGPAFTTVSSDDPYLDGSSVKTGLNVGVAAGFAIAPTSPLYLESGLYYTEKGGKGKAGGNSFTYQLDYLEVPLVFKYKYDASRDLSVQPFLGGYVACGVGGQIKDFNQRAAYSSFSDNPYSFQRFDGGVKLGCGLQYDMLYAELAWDIGLANISHDSFDTSKNSAVMLTVGLDF